MEIIQTQGLISHLDELSLAVIKRSTSVRHIIEKMQNLQESIEELPDELAEKLEALFSMNLHMHNSQEGALITSKIAEVQVLLERILESPIRQNSDGSFQISGDLREEIEQYIAQGIFQNIGEYLLYAAATLNWSLRNVGSNRKIVAYTEGDNSYRELSIGAFDRLRQKKKSPPQR